MRGQWIMAGVAIVFSAVGWIGAPNAARAEGQVVRVAATPALVQSGLLDWLAPRFRFKTRVSIEPAAPEAADLLLIEAGEAAAGDGARTPFASRGTAQFVAIARDGAGEANAKKLVGWLISSAGARAIQKFEPTDGLAFGPPGDAAPVETVAARNEATLIGEKLSLQHCGRCHVISEKNKYGGIGSTPSFAALRAIPTWRDKFDAFWTLNPHPSFTQVEGVTEPFAPERPPHIAPVELTLPEVEAIGAYVATIKPKDLGGAMKTQ